MTKSVFIKVLEWWMNEVDSCAQNVPI